MIHDLSINAMMIIAMKIQFNPTQSQGPKFSSINSPQYYCSNHAILFHESRFHHTYVKILSPCYYQRMIISHFLTLLIM
jgi:hypothetical protein